jgi:hypothetical protein
MRYKRKINLVLAGLVLAALAIPASAGDQVPFVGTVSGQVVLVTPQDSEHLLFDVDVVGHATHLGRFTGKAQVVQNVVDGSYVGSYTWTAANGDTIFGTFSGQLIPTGTPGVFDNFEHSIVTGGTGRFEGATGNSTLTGQLDTITLSFLYPIDGTLSSVGSNQ